MLYGILEEDPSIDNNRKLIAVFATPLSILSEPQGVTVESINLKRYSMEQTAQRWVVESQLIPQDEPPDMLSNRLNSGEVGDVFIQMPQPYSRSETVMTGAPRVLADALKRNRTIRVSGVFYPNVFVSFGKYPSKVYLVSRVDSIAGTITIFPGLVENVVIDTPVFHGKDVIMRANYDDSVIRGIQYDNGILASLGTVRFVEVV